MSEENVNAKPKVESVDSMLESAFSMKSIAGLAASGMINEDQKKELLVGIDNILGMIKSMLLSKDKTYILKNIKGEWWIFDLKKENILELSITEDSKHYKVDDLVDKLKMMLDAC